MSARIREVPGLPAVRPIAFAVTIDTEEEWDWTGPWPVRDFAVENIHQLPRFQNLCERYGVHATYFVNHAVLARPETRRVMLGFARKPTVELGMHIHPWNTPPIHEETVSARATFLHNLPADLAWAKLDHTYRWFREFGLSPTSFRGGRYSCGEIGQRFLRDRGFLVDASVCPFSTWPDDGAPDYRDRCLEPVRRQQPGSSNWPLWELPLTLAFTRQPMRAWRGAYEFIERTALSKLRLIGIAERLGIVRRIWLNFESESADRMLQLLRRIPSWGLPFICFTVHSSSLSLGPNPYARTTEQLDKIYTNIERVFAYLRQSSQYEPATITRIAHHLEERFHASSGN